MPGDKVSLRTYARGFTVIGDRGPTGGVLKVYVDGIRVGVVNLYAPVLRVRQALFTSAPSAEVDVHRLDLVAAGSGSRSRIVNDAIAVPR